MTNQLLPLLQWCDSNFPTGAFSHSFGLETYIQEGRVSDKETFAAWLYPYIQEQLVYTDGLICRFAYEALDKKDHDKIVYWDRLAAVQNLSRESREANIKMGRRFIQLGLEMYDIEDLRIYQKQVESHQASGHPAIGFAIIAHHLGIPKPTAVLAYLYTCTSNMIQNGVRGIPLGQTDGQRLLQDLQSTLQKAADMIDGLEPDDFGSISPGLELSQMRHERLNVRIFMS
ncbi:urease accessory protein [Scopulibacillus daqui]|uniref:Urease accessory protein UreF n=2 Tax=Scopulibacillus daqui TaxID=1469162 RepID=A0ABS2Q484_9BACL|nr:urease accessory protein UreF [Scopulibacillus daqui]MBM7646504.1 urease accessory protein [Scopulibacillus daqui]